MKQFKRIILTRTFTFFIAALVWHLERDNASAQAPISVEINANQVLWTVPENYHGTNFVALWNNTGDSAGAVNAFSQMGFRLLRFPGGVPAEFYDWERPLQSGFTQITPEQAYHLAKAGDASMIFQTNAFNDKKDTNKKTGESYQWDNSGKHAADWVLHAKQVGMKVAFWEIGNEPEMDAPKEAKKSQDAVFKAYDDKFEEQARAIKGADAAAKIMGPASTNTYFWWQEKNLEKFMKAEGNQEGTGLVDAVSLHWYPGGDGGTWEAKRGTAQTWEPAMQYITSVMKKYDSRALPLYITEWNWAGSDKNDSAAKFSNALGCADCVGMFLRTGVSGYTHFCLQHIQRNWGFLATDHDLKPQDEASPTYYALAMASYLGGRVLGTKDSADEKNVLSAYATSSDPGTVCVMLINKTEQEQDVNLSFSGFLPVAGNVWTLLPENGGINDTGVIYNGKKSPSPATGKLPEPAQIRAAGGQLTQKMMPYSLTVISLTSRPGARAAALSNPPVSHGG